MVLAVMQPTYIPWAGYFNLIAKADVFVFLDDVQFARSTWQARNRVLASGKEHMLTVPTKRVSLQQKIKDVEIQDSEKWRHKHLSSLTQNYAKSPFGKQVLDVMQVISDESIDKLADLNIRIIRDFSQQLGLAATQFHRASMLGIEGNRSERLIRMARHFGCDTYRSPCGAQDYLEEDGLFRDSKVQLVYQQYEPKVYDQGIRAPFISHLSIVDVVGNLGWAGARVYLEM